MAFGFRVCILCGATKHNKLEYSKWSCVPMEHMKGGVDIILKYLWSIRRRCRCHPTERVERVRDGLWCLNTSTAKYILKFKYEFNTQNIGHRTYYFTWIKSKVCNVFVIVLYYIYNSKLNNLWLVFIGCRMPPVKLALGATGAISGPPHGSIRSLEAGAGAGGVTLETGWETWDELVLMTA